MKKLVDISSEEELILDDKDELDVDINNYLMKSTNCIN
jgi:hypothetical protein